MKLLDLPAELMRDIVNEMVATVGLYQSIRLRLVCKLFDEVIFDNLCREPERNFVNRYVHFPFNGTIPPPFQAKVIKISLEQDTQREKPMSRLFDQVVDLVLESEPEEPARVGNTRFSSQREKLLDALSQQMSHDCPVWFAWNGGWDSEVGQGWTAEAKILAALTAAAATGNIPAMERLIGRYSLDKWYLDSEPPLFGTALPAATFHGQLEATLYLLDLAAKRDLSSDHGWCHAADRELILKSLHRASRLEIIDIAFMPKYELCYSGRDYERAILEAVSRRQGKVAMYLFDHAEGIENVTIFREKMFQYAAKHGCEQTMAALMISEVGVEGMPLGTLEEGLNIASVRGHTKVVQHLMGGKNTVTSRILNEGLVQASRRDHYQVAQLLLDRGADINLRPESEPWRPSYRIGTPICVAAMANQPHMVRFLLERGANVNAHGHGSFALYFACLLGLDTIVSLLVKAGVDPNYRVKHHDHSEKSAIQVAMVAGHDNVVRLLLRLGAEPQEPLSFKPCFFGMEFRTILRRGGMGDRDKRFPYPTYPRLVSEHVKCMDEERRSKMFAAIGCTQCTTMIQKY